MNTKTRQIIIECPTSIFEIKPGEHFPVKLIKQNFDISLISHLSDAAKDIEDGCKIELTNGRATIVAQRVNETLIQLITGWVGKRKTRSSL